MRNRAKRLGSFIASLMPADRGFFFLLLGSTLLFISSSLGWWHGWKTAVLGTSRNSGTAIGTLAIAAWREILPFSSFPLKLAGAAGFFVCFFPGRFPLRRLRLWVCLPAALGIAMPFVLVSAAALGIQGKTNPWGNGDLISLSGMSKITWNAGTGLHFALLGLVFIILGESRLRRGLAVLPIHLKSTTPQSADIASQQSDEHTWTKFVWFAITLMNEVGVVGGAIAASILGRAFDATYFGFTHSHAIWFLKTLVLVIAAGVFLLLVLSLAGESRWEVLRNSIRLPFPEYFAIGFLLPLAIYVVPQIFADIYDPSRPLPSPRVADSTMTPALIFFNLCLFALVEEIAWRGYLQPRFIARFGVYRGIFFVGMVWAAFHFSGDFRANQTDANVIRALVGRMLGAILIGFALSWLTLRSKSVLPAALAHATQNGLSECGAPSYWLELGLWALAVFLLFRFWPPRELTSAISAPSLHEAKTPP